VRRLADIWGRWRPPRRHRDVQRFNDGRLVRVRVPGRDEDYVVVIFPLEE
jgi:hypothetical protein